MSQAVALIQRAVAFPKPFLKVFTPVWLSALLAIVAVDLGSKLWMTENLNFNLHGEQGRFVTSPEHLRTHIDGVGQINLLGEEGAYIKFRLVFNDRFIFGIGPSLPVFGFLLTLVATVFLALYRWRAPDLGHPFAWLLVFSGAIGNLIDKAFLKSLVDRSWSFGIIPREGYVQGVVDFVECIWFGWDAVAHIPILNVLAWEKWPSFNLADSCIVVGVILLVFTIGEAQADPTKDKDQA